MGDTTVCLLLVPSFPQGVKLEQQAGISLAPGGKCYLCRATFPRRDSTCLPRAGTCPGHKMKYRGKKPFYMVRVVQRWHKLPGELVESPSFKILKTQLDTALSNLLQGLGWACSRNAFLPQLGCVFCIMDLVGSLIRTATCSCKINTDV